MYSHEIEQFLKERNYEITPFEFVSIINTSPQIKQVLLEKNDAIYTIVTDDNYRRDIKIVKKLQFKKDSE